MRLVFRNNTPIHPGPNGQLQGSFDRGEDQEGSVSVCGPSPIGPGYFLDEQTGDNWINPICFAKVEPVYLLLIIFLK